MSSELHAATVARIIGVMVRTHTGLDDSTTLRNMNATGTSLWDKDKVQTLFLLDIVKDRLANDRRSGRLHDSEIIIDFIILVGVVLHRPEVGL